MALGRVEAAQDAPKTMCRMSLPNTGQRKIRPTHPGEMLREDFLPDYGLTVASLAGAWASPANQ